MSSDQSRFHCVTSQLHPNSSTPHTHPSMILSAQTTTQRSASPNISSNPPCSSFVRNSQIQTTPLQQQLTPRMTPPGTANTRLSSSAIAMTFDSTFKGAAVALIPHKSPVGDKVHQLPFVLVRNSINRNPTFQDKREVDDGFTQTQDHLPLLKAHLTTLSNKRLNGTMRTYWQKFFQFLYHPYVHSNQKYDE